MYKTDTKTKKKIKVKDCDPKTPILDTVNKSKVYCGETEYKAEYTEGFTGQGGLPEIYCTEKNKPKKYDCNEDKECKSDPPNYTYECITAMVQCPVGEKIECFLFASFG